MKEVSQLYPIQPNAIRASFLSVVCVAVGIWMFISISVLLDTDSRSANLILSLPLSVAAFLSIFLLGAYLYIREYYKTLEFGIDRNRFWIIKDPLSTHEITIPLERVQHTIIRQGFFERLFDIYSVNVSAASLGTEETGTVPGLAKDDAIAFRQELLDRVLEVQQLHKTSQLRNQTQQKSDVVVDTTDINGSHINTSKILFKLLLPQIVALFAIVPVIIFFSVISVKYGDTYVLVWLSSITIGIWLAYYITVSAWTRMVIQHFSFHIDTKGLQVWQGVINKTHRYIQGSAIQQMYVHHDFIDKQLGIATLIIETASDHGGISRYNDTSSRPFSSVGYDGNKITIPGLPTDLAYELSNKVSRFSDMRSQGLGL